MKKNVLKPSWLPSLKSTIAVTNLLLPKWSPNNAFFYNRYLGYRCRKRLLPRLIYDSNCYWAMGFSWSLVRYSDFNHSTFTVAKVQYPPLALILLQYPLILLMPILHFSDLIIVTNFDVCQWLLAYCYSQPPGTLWLSNIGLSWYLGWMTVLACQFLVMRL